MAQATMIGHGTPRIESIVQVRNTIKPQQCYTHIFLDQVKKGGWEHLPLCQRKWKSWEFLFFRIHAARNLTENTDQVMSLAVVMVIIVLLHSKALRH